MVQIIPFVNHKGWVGKSTTVQNVGAGLAQFGKKVLMIDLDPQANLSDAYGVWENKSSVYDVLVKEESPEVIKVEPNLYIIPSSLDLTAAEIELSGRTAREQLLKEALKKIDSDFDYILIDCPPSLGILTINALVASDKVFIPMDAEYFSMKGLDKLNYVIDEIKKFLNPEIETSGVIITKFDDRLVLHRATETLLKKYLPGKLFKTRIRRNISLAEAPSKEQSIFRYDPKSNGAQDYSDLCHEILEKFE